MSRPTIQIVPTSIELVGVVLGVWALFWWARLVDALDEAHSHGYSHGVAEESGRIHFHCGRCGEIDWR